VFYNTSRPFFYIGKIPVTVVGLIILAQLAGMITWVIYGGIQQSSLLEKTAFIPAAQPVAFLFGCHFLSLAVFCGFCVMHPNMPFFILKIPMKWIGLVFFLGTVLSLVGIGDFSLAVIYMLSTVFTVWMIQCKGLATSPKILKSIRF